MDYIYKLHFKSGEVFYIECENRLIIEIMNRINTKQGNKMFYWWNDDKIVCGGFVPNEIVFIEKEKQ